MDIQKCLVRTMTAIAAKVRIKEKAVFEELCKTKGLTPSQAIRSFIIDCNERVAIGELKIHDARYMARYGILQMR